MPKGLFHANDPAQDYEIRGILDPDYADSRATPLDATYEIIHTATWGVPFLTGVTGVRCTIDLVFNSGAGTWGWTATLEWPAGWGATPAAVTGTGFPVTDITNLFAFSNAPLTADSGCNWAFSFDGFTWKINGTTSGSCGAQSMSGSGYDGRYNCNACPGSCFSDADPIPTSDYPPDCGASYGAQATPLVNLENHITTGWRFSDPGVNDWHSDSVSFKNDDAPGEVDCSPCSGAVLEGVSVDTDSWTIRYIEYWVDEVTKDDIGDYHCVCTDGSGGYSDQHLWYTKRVRTVGRGGVDAAVPSSSKIDPLHTERHALCRVGPVATSVDSSADLSDPSITYSLMTRTVKQWTYTKVCTQFLGGIDCFPGHSPPDAGSHDCLPGLIIPDNTSCYYEASIIHTWARSPLCSPSALWPWNHEDPDGKMVRTDVEDGDVWVYASNHHIPDFATSVQVTSSGDTIRPTISEDFRKRLHLTYTRLAAGVPSAFWRWSDDDGATFNAETAIGIANGKYACVFSSIDGDVVFGAFVYNSGHSGVGKIYYRYWGSGVQWADVPAAATIKDSAGSDLVFSDDTFAFAFGVDGARRLYLHANVDGDGHTSLWQCFNFEDSASWGNKETQITSGHYPTVYCSADAEVGVAALVYNSGPGPGEIYTRFQTPGLQWSGVPAAAAMKDHAGSALVFQDTTFQLSFAAHGARALVVSALLDGDTAVSEWQSWDESTSILRVT